MNHHRWNRNHAHDLQGADGLHRLQNHVCSQPVLQPCSLTSNAAKLLLWPDATVATESHMSPQVGVRWLRIHVNHHPVLIDSIARCLAAASAGLVL
jgi:hypothetical protein